MKIIVSLFTLLSFQVALAKTVITCNSGDVVPEFILEVEYKSEPWSLVETYKERDEQGRILNTSKETLLSSSKICGVKVDLKKDCKLEERSLGPRQYVYAFDCPGKVSGDLVFVRAKVGMIALSCDGNDVPYNLRRKSYINCQLVTQK